MTAEGKPARVMSDVVVYPEIVLKLYRLCDFLLDGQEHTMMSRSNNVRRLKSSLAFVPPASMWRRCTPQSILQHLLYEGANDDTRVCRCSNDLTVASDPVFRGYVQQRRRDVSARPRPASRPAATASSFVPQPAWTLLNASNFHVRLSPCSTQSSHFATAHHCP